MCSSDLIGFDSTSTSGHGILLYNARKNIIITNNTIKNSHDPGDGSAIRLVTPAGTTEHIQIFGNQLYDDQETPTQEYGIYANGAGSFSDIQVAGSYFAGNQTADVSGLPTSSVRFDSNINLQSHDFTTTGKVTISGGLNIPTDVAGVNAGDIRYNSTDVALEYFDGSNFHDAGSPKYIYIKASAQSEGDLHLLDASNWATSKANIKTIRVVTSSTDWDMYILQNDNGFATDDANIPKKQIMEAGNGDTDIYLDLPFEDEDASSEVHIYYLDNSGANTADIYVIGEKMR